MDQKRRRVVIAVYYCKIINNMNSPRPKGNRRSSGDWRVIESGLELDHASVFSEIYRSGVWGGSGSGSLAATTGPYRSLLERMLAVRNIRRVADLGCGD